MRTAKSFTASVSVVRGPKNTHFEHEKHEDGCVTTTLVDQLGFELEHAMTSRRAGETGYADAVCRNQDTIMERMGWDE